MKDKVTTIEDLKKIKRSFIEERNWEQFHTPKNITMALAVEAAELMELFMWSDNQQSIRELERKREQVEHEVADVFAYLLSLCARYDIDLAQAFEKKMKLNAEKYPIEKSKELATKLSNL